LSITNLIEGAMNRLLACLLATFVNASVVAAQNPQSAEVRTVPVANGVYMLMGNGGNIGVSIGPDATFIVDDQYAPMVPNVVAAIAKLTDKPVKSF
jgi:cyclase